MFSNCYRNSSLHAGTVLCAINLCNWWKKKEQWLENYERNNNNNNKKG